mgnify:CR=1 FL=1
MRVIALVAVCVFFAGCSSNKVDDFKSNQNAKVYSFDSIGKLSGAPLAVDPIKGELSESDSLVVIDGQKTAFDIYSFKSAPGAHMLTMKTYCDCLGFNKDLLLPEVRVVDASGKIIETSLMSKRRVQPLLGAFYFEFTWVFDTVTADTVKIVIGSNNQNLGDVATTVSGTGAVGVPSASATYYTSFTIDGLKVRSAPYGKYEVFAE